MDKGNTLERRSFLAQGALVLAGITAGTLMPLEAEMKMGGRREFLKTIAPAAGGAQGGDPVMGFGWEVSNIDNNGADVFFEVRETMVLNAVNVDVAFMITSAPPEAGFAEVLCNGGVSRGAKPTFSEPPQAYINFAPDPNFGSMTEHNPNRLNVGLGGVVQDMFFNVILKTWVPAADGTGGATWRHFASSPGLALNKGDYLVFHMDHAGVGGDVEMQAVLQYSLV